MAETHELRASPPYEGVPNILQFRFNNQYSMDVFFVFIYVPTSLLTVCGLYSVSS